jgi:hypothetical protein
MRLGAPNTIKVTEVNAFIEDEIAKRTEPAIEGLIVSFA